MRAYLGLSCLVVALGWLGCGANSASDAGGAGKNETGNHEWLEGDPEETFTTEGGTAGDLSAGTGGAPTRPPSPSGGAGGTGAQLPSPLCATYDHTKYNHTLTGAALDPGNLASATRAREALEQGLPPVPAAVRLPDFVNYYARTPVTNVLDGELSGVVELRARKIAGQEIPNQFDLYVGVTAGKVARPQVVMTILVDATLTPKALTRAQAAIAGLGKGLRAGDHVVLMSADPSIAPIELASLADPANELADLASKVTLGTGSIGLRLPQALEKASGAPAGSWNRVVVVSDGEENAKETSFPAIESAAKDSKIFLSAIGVSPESSYGDAYLYRLARAGRGRYLYVDDPTEPDTLFAQRFDELFGYARDNVRIRVDLPYWMHSLEPDPSGASGSPQDKYLAPGEWARFVFRVAACDAAAVYDLALGPVPLTVAVSSTLPDGGATDPIVLKSQPVKKFLAITQNPELDKMAAIQAFVDVLEYPHESRFKEAKTTLSAIAQSPAPELLGLLDKHPNLPAP